MYNTQKLQKLQYDTAQKLHAAYFNPTFPLTMYISSNELCQIKKEIFYQMQVV